MKGDLQSSLEISVLSEEVAFVEGHGQTLTVD
jgi:hypothetical protein